MDKFVSVRWEFLCMNFIHIHEVCFIALLVFAFAFVLQITFWWVVYGKLGFYEVKERNTNSEPVSVVLLVNDELEKLRVQLPALLEQDYPDYEIVLVVQSAHDDMIEYIDHIRLEHPELKVVELYQDLNFFKGNKFALSIGIKSAKNDLLVITEVGCIPVSNQWLREIQARFGRGKEIVLGYHRTESHPERYLSGFIRFGNLVTAMRYLSFALAGRPFMGLNKNLAYRRSLFYRIQGFTSHYRISDGEDDLFVNRASTSRNVAIAISPESQVKCALPPSFSSWVRHRKRYLRTRRYYRAGDVFFLGLYSSSYVLFLASFAYLVITQCLLYPVVSLFILRLFSQLFVFKKTMNRLGERKLLLLSPVNEVLLMILDGMIRISLVFDKKDKWKT